MLVRLLLVALLGISLASAKTYNFTLSNQAKAGSTTLKAGQYTLKVDGSKVTLKDATGQNVPAKTKVENADQTFRDTEVSTTQKNGNEQVQWIGLGGSRNRIVFE